MIYESKRVYNYTYDETMIKNRTVRKIVKLTNDISKLVAPSRFTPDLKKQLSKLNKDCRRANRKIRYYNK
jgi:hypothetical protein